MSTTLILPIYFTLEQVQDFGRITGDDGPVHSVQGIVQGGFIISMLPKWLNQLLAEHNLLTGMDHSVSMILEAKFRNKLAANTLANVSFSYSEPGVTVSKLNWRVYDDSREYCFGKWVIHKS